MGTDSELVARLRNRDPSALGEVYARYADRLFTYAVGQMGGDRDRAGDAVSDTFLLAYDRIDQLRDPDRLRAWLYAITRSECLRRHRSAARTVALGEGHDVIDTSAAVDQDLERSEARELVATTLGTLNDPDREVLELALRHDLDATAVASIMGLSATHVGARLSRARKQLEKALLSAMFVRTRGADCSQLEEILAGADEGSKLLRKRVTRHVDNCAECERRKPGMVAAIPSLAVLPMVAAPDSLRRLVFSGRPGGEESALDTAGSERVPHDGPGTSPPDPSAGQAALAASKTGPPSRRTEAPPGDGGPLAPVPVPVPVAASDVAELARRAAEVSRDRPPFGADGFPTTTALGDRSRGVLIVLAAAAVAMLVGGLIWWTSTEADELAAGTNQALGAAAATGTTPAASAQPPQPSQTQAKEEPATELDDGTQTSADDPPVGVAEPAPVDAAAQGTAPLPLSAGGGDPKKPPAAPTQPVKTPKPTPSPSPSGTRQPRPTPTATPQPTPTASPTQTTSPTPAPSPSASPTVTVGPLPTLSWTFTDLAAGSCPAVFSGEVTATVAGGAVATATAVWTDTFTSATGRQNLTKSGDTFSGTVTGMPTQTTVLMTVEALAEDGRTLVEQVRDVSHICPG